MMLEAHLCEFYDFKLFEKNCSRNLFETCFQIFPSGVVTPPVESTGSAPSGAPASGAPVEDAGPAHPTGHLKK